MRNGNTFHSLETHAPHHRIGRSSKSPEYTHRACTACALHIVLPLKHQKQEAAERLKRCAGPLGPRCYNASTSHRTPSTTSHRQNKCRARKRATENNQHQYLKKGGTKQNTCEKHNHYRTVVKHQTWVCPTDVSNVSSQPHVQGSNEGPGRGGHRG